MSSKVIGLKKYYHHWFSIVCFLNMSIELKNPSNLIAEQNLRTLLALFMHTPEFFEKDQIELSK